MYNDVVSLISKTYIKNNIGQMIASEVVREVFCNIQSVSASEFANAGAIGLKPAYQIKIWTDDYNNEDIVEYNGIRYSVYRTYDSENGRTELYVEKDVGA